MKRFLTPLIVLFVGSAGLFGMIEMKKGITMQIQNVPKSSQIPALEVVSQIPHTTPVPSNTTSPQTTTVTTTPQTPTVVTPPPQTTTPKANTYSLADVAKHAKASDCWMVVDTGVFDVTAYVTRHPGGARIVQGCGKDATDMFFNISKHGGRAEDILAGYYIGDLS